MEIYVKSEYLPQFSRSSYPELFRINDVLRNLAKFTGKHLCHSLFFNKFAGLRPTTLLKKRLWHRRFPLKFAKFLRSPFFTEHLWWLLLVFLEHLAFSQIHDLLDQIYFQKIGLGLKKNNLFLTIYLQIDRISLKWIMEMSSTLVNFPTKLNSLIYVNFSKSYLNKD